MSKFVLVKKTYQIGWTELPNTKISDVLPLDAYAAYPEMIGNGSNCITEAWNSAAYDSRRNRLLILGGGHHDYYGNEIYSLNLYLNPVTMTRITDPGLPPNHDDPDSSDYWSHVTSAATDFGAQPNSRHTYDKVTYCSNVDKMYIEGGSMAGAGGFTDDTWLFDCSSNAWEYKTPDTKPGLSSGGQIAVYDPTAGRVLFHDNNDVFGYDPLTDDYTLLGNNNDNIDIWKVGVIDPIRKKMVIVGHGDDFVIDLSAGTDYSLDALSSTGETGLLAATYPGVAYCSSDGLIYGWNGGDDVYSLNLDTLAWAKTTYTGGPTAVINGTFKRFAWCNLLGVFVCVNATNQNAYALRVS